jgi:hypothetical protein
LDAYATGYADARDKGAEPMEAQAVAMQHGAKPVMGQGVDPGFYGSPNVNRDIWNIMGQIGNLGSFGTGMDGGTMFSPNQGNIMGILDNPYFFKENPITGDPTTGQVGVGPGQPPIAFNNFMAGRKPMQAMNPAFYQYLLNYILGNQEETDDTLEIPGLAGGEGVPGQQQYYIPGGTQWRF